MHKRQLTMKWLFACLLFIGMTIGWLSSEWRYRTVSRRLDDQSLQLEVTENRSIPNLACAESILGNLFIGQSVEDVIRAIALESEIVFEASGAVAKKRFLKHSVVKHHGSDAYEVPKTHFTAWAFSSWHFYETGWIATIDETKTFRLHQIEIPEAFYVNLPEVLSYEPDYLVIIEQDGIVIHVGIWRHNFAPDH